MLTLRFSRCDSDNAPNTWLKDNREFHLPVPELGFCFLFGPTYKSSNTQHRREVTIALLKLLLDSYQGAEVFLFQEYPLYEIVILLNKMYNEIVILFFISFQPP